MDPKKPVFLLVSFFFQGCYGSMNGLEPETADHPSDNGGGTDEVTADLPFAAGYETKCVQGANGSYSHGYQSTKYDLDLDTPNSWHDLVHAPASGTAYVHDDGTRNFGRHVNLDLHDGTYLLLGHLNEVFVENGAPVVAGQLLGHEGTTGASSGDHVHYGRHAGNAQRSAVYGASLAGFRLRAVDVTTGLEVEPLTTAAVCSLSGGHVYRSKLPVAKWHPVGTFLKSPSASLVYERTANGGLSAFMNETAFLSRGYSFEDVVLVSHEEIACYVATAGVSDQGRVRALKDSAGKGWLLLGQLDDSARQRFEVSQTGAAALLSSYGVRVSSFDDIDHGQDAELSQYPSAGRASFRTGSLVSEEGHSDVYVMDEGVAMPIRDWDTYLLMGFWGRDIIRVTAAEFSANITAQGNCLTDQYCVTREDVIECNHTEEVNHEQQGHEDSGIDLPQGEDTGDHGDSALAGEAFALRWTTPGGLNADWITVAGTWTLHSGEVTPWDPVLAEAHGQNSVSYSQLDVSSGDRFRFSMAYGLGNTESWSCLAPFPPGLVQGTVDARVNGVSVPARTVADPHSAGCQLEIVIP